MGIIAPSRRGFLTGIIALGVAPAIVRAESLMAIKPLLVAPEVISWQDDYYCVITQTSVAGDFSLSNKIWSRKLHIALMNDSILANFASAA